MSILQDESLSALVDDELSEIELHRLMKSMDDDGDWREKREKWRSYQLISNAMQRNHTDASKAQWDISASVAAAIEDEAVHGGSEFSSENKRDHTSEKTATVSALPNKYFGGFAIAASVVLAAVVSFSMLQSGSEIQGAPDLANLDTNFEVPAEQLVSTAKTVSVEAQSAELRQHFERLKLQHVQNAELNGHEGLMPYARVTSYDEN